MDACETHVNGGPGRVAGGSRWEPKWRTGSRLNGEGPGEADRSGSVDALAVGAVLEMLGAVA